MGSRGYWDILKELGENITRFTLKFLITSTKMILASESIFWKQIQ